MDISPRCLLLEVISEDRLWTGFASTYTSTEESRFYFMKTAGKDLAQNFRTFLVGGITTGTGQTERPAVCLLFCISSRMTLNHFQHFPSTFKLFQVAKSVTDSH